MRSQKRENLLFQSKVFSTKKIHMKQKMKDIRLLVIIVLLFGITGCYDAVQKENNVKMKPFEQLFFQRSYPDATIDVKTINRITSAVRLQFSIDKNVNDASWRLEGPTNIGGRINCIAIHPSNNDVMLVGNSTGGIFRTINGANTWEPVGDDLSHLAIGSIAFGNQNPDIIYAGSGDPNISGLPHIGNGMYKSLDGGESWENVGLEETRIISRIVVDPSNDNIVYAATMGLPFERNDDRGLYKTIDGGLNWEQILFVSDEAGITDVVMDPSDTQILYAASWTRIRNNTESLVYGEDAHIYKSTDGGEAWVTLSGGLPTDSQGRIGLAISQTNGNKLYSLWVGTNSQIQGVYSTTDGGQNWTELNSTGNLVGALGGFGWYFAQIRVSPVDDDEVSVLGVNMFTSFDGGQNWDLTTPEWWTYEVHADKHDMQYVDENTVILATDGGLYRSSDHFGSWQDIEDIPNTQFYRLAINPHEIGDYTGGAQDNGTTTGSFEEPNQWVRDYGGDGFQALFDPEDSNIKYAETQNGGLVKSYDSGNSWEGFNQGISGDDRVNWDAPIILSHHNNSILYTGTFRIYKNVNNTWISISDDLTDGNIYGARYHTITTIDESPIQEGVLYVGTTDANVWRSMNGGTSWQNITDGLPERYVTNIKASPENGSTVYVTHSGFKDNDNIAHIHRSTDHGDSWIDITGDLIEQPVNHIEIMNDSVLFAATDMGVYMTCNSGEQWSRVGSNMPIIPVFDIEIDVNLNRLVASTFARSIQSISIDSLLLDVDVAIQEESFDNEINVFPNPASNRIVVNGFHEDWVATWYGLDGKLLKKQDYSSDDKVIGLKEFPNGVFFVVLSSNTQVVSKQIIIFR